jgi:hypothetical protein
MLLQSAAVSAAARLGRVAPSSLSKLQDWINRSTAAGVTQARRFTTSTDVTNYRHGDSQAANVVFQAGGGIIGDGCLRINVPSTDGANSGAWRAPVIAGMADGAGFGSAEWFVQFRVKLGPGRLTPSVSGGGFKICNMSEYIPSSPNSSRSHASNEIVLNNQNWYGILTSYREHPVSGPTLLDRTDGNGIHLQTAVDHGSGSPNDRYCLYDSGDASAGCWFFAEQQWFTVLMRIKIADYGGTGTGNEFDLWVARDGETTYTQLQDVRNFRIGADGALPNGINGVWFLPYDTNRDSASYTTWHEYDQLIVSTQPIACPAI